MKAPLSYPAGLLLSAILALAQAPDTTQPLPSPEQSGGMPLMDALSLRVTRREFSTRPLDLQQISNLLWAAFGVNRPDGKRTAPSARNWQETDIYVLAKSGAYLYRAGPHDLLVITREDIRALGGTQPFVKDAPITLVLVADMAKAGSAPAEQRREAVALDAGFIAENVYLFCASERLATGARASIDREALAAKLKLRPDQYIVLAQSVGYIAGH